MSPSTGDGDRPGNAIWEPPASLMRLINQLNINNFGTEGLAEG